MSRFSIDIEATCDDCGRELKVKVKEARHHNDNDTLEIVPCAACMDAVRSEAFKEGRKEAEDECDAAEAERKAENERHREPPDDPTT